MGGVLLAADPVRELGSPSPRLVFSDLPNRRTLSVDGATAFELNWWCGTCPYLFERQPGARTAPSVDGLRDRLDSGLDRVDDDVVTAYGSLLPEGGYLPMLLEATPRRVAPGGVGDFFTAENRVTWGQPEAGASPGTEYYRTFETRIDDDAHLYEFVVPMVPPSWNEPATVDEHAERLAKGAAPTAVALTTLDVIDPVWAEAGSDLHTQWCLTHFLLDGHHKIAAAARLGRPMRLLALLSLDNSLADEDQVARLHELLGRPPAGRVPQPWFPPPPPLVPGWRRWFRPR